MINRMLSFVVNNGAQRLHAFGPFEPGAFIREFRMCVAGGDERGGRFRIAMVALGKRPPGLAQFTEATEWICDEVILGGSASSTKQVPLDRVYPVGILVDKWKWLILKVNCLNGSENTRGFASVVVGEGGEDD